MNATRTVLDLAKMEASLLVRSLLVLAAGRARRNGLADLYASFPATTATRTLAHLAGLAGAVPASLLLMLAAGAAGVAIGSRFPHPLAGVLGTLVLLLSSGTSHLASGAAIWLTPWEMEADQLANLPGPLAGYPPVGAHAAELAPSPRGAARVRGVAPLAGQLPVRRDMRR